MSTLMEDVKKMPISERIQLVEDIWDTIATVPSDSHGTLKLTEKELVELDRRRDAHKADPTSGIPWEEVRSKLFRR
ncbi:MAG: addiction module protein [Thermodesulfobacteriota bacterium]|nr:addiction module protein [Thermodesulfobacteriota bacterium]